jgi:hypothetical protein
VPFALSATVRRGANRPLHIPSASTAPTFVGKGWPFLHAQDATVSCPVTTMGTKVAFGFARQKPVIAGVGVRLVSAFASQGMFAP